MQGVEVTVRVRVSNFDEGFRWYQELWGRAHSDLWSRYPSEDFCSPHRMTILV